MGVRLSTGVRSVALAASLASPAGAAGGAARKGPVTSLNPKTLTWQDAGNALGALKQAHAAPKGPSGLASLEQLLDLLKVVEASDVRRARDPDALYGFQSTWGQVATTFVEHAAAALESNPVTADCRTGLALEKRLAAEYRFNSAHATDLISKLKWARRECKDL